MKRDPEAEQKWIDEALVKAPPLTPGQIRALRPLLNPRPVSFPKSEE